MTLVFLQLRAATTRYSLAAAAAAVSSRRRSKLSASFSPIITHVRCRFVAITAGKIDASATHSPSTPCTAPSCRKRPLFFRSSQLFPCSSRACLGKWILLCVANGSKMMGFRTVSTTESSAETPIRQLPMCDASSNASFR